MICRGGVRSGRGQRDEGIFFGAGLGCWVSAACDGVGPGGGCAAVLIVGEGVLMRWVGTVFAPSPLKCFLRMMVVVNHILQTVLRRSWNARQSGTMLTLTRVISGLRGKIEKLPSSVHVQLESCLWWSLDLLG